jgi:uncharacterized repeat protein (TIGR03803 family)
MFWICDSVAQRSEFYGVTHSGGELNTGSIFKTDINGNFHVIWNFQSLNLGSLPVGQLCEAENLKLYGMTYGGGNMGKGTLFEYDPSSKTFTKKLDFNGSGNGAFPGNSLVSAPNGKLYGTASSGGEFDQGVLFEWDPSTDIYNKLFDFSCDSSGCQPGSILVGSDGSIYGLTPTGGIYNKGILYRWDISKDSLTKLHEFNGNDGENPYSNLMEASNGKLYGLTWDGGEYKKGVLFEWDPITYVYSKKVDFNGTEYGREPNGQLLEAPNGKLYGMTSNGGVFDDGVLFEWDPVENIFTKEFDFNGENGDYPYGSLIASDSGTIYGLSTFGGSFGEGVMFEWDPVRKTYIKLLDFNHEENGAFPAFLMMATNKKIYCVTAAGSVNQAGTIIEYDPLTCLITREMSFIDKYAVDGKYPTGTLVLADNGKLYGLTGEGGMGADTLRGEYANGVLFEFDPVTEVYLKKFDFQWAENGGNPTGSLVKGNNGSLYGMTPYGGIYGGSYSGYISNGVLFEWNPFSDHFAVKHKFDKYEGSYPQGSLIKADNGRLYGMTSSGGTNDCGVIFEYDYDSDLFTKLFDFQLENYGGDPRGSLTQADNGKLYGMTFSGGSNNNGVIFEWDILLQSFEKKYDFALNEDGRMSGGTFALATNGKLYGMSSKGGNDNWGMLFEWDPENDQFAKKFDFDKSYGNSWHGSLTSCENGMLYGVTYDENEKGSLFEWDPIIDSMIIRYDLTEMNAKNSKNVLSLIHTANSQNNMKPFFSSGLTEIKTDSYDTLIIEACSIYSSPSGRYRWSLSGNYSDTIPNRAGFDSVITVYLNINNVDNTITLNQSVLLANASDVSYQWINCSNENAPIEGETGQTFTATADGSYAVIVNQNGCMDTSECIEVNLTGLMFSSFKENIILYPNPSEGSFNIDMGKEFPECEITVVQPDGRIIRKELFRNRKAFDLRLTAVSGQYLMIIRAGNEQAIFKIIKK